MHLISSVALIINFCIECEDLISGWRVFDADVMKAIFMLEWVDSEGTDDAIPGSRASSEFALHFCKNAQAQMVMLKKCYIAAAAGGVDKIK